MFKIITVEREYGAGGSLVAAELARRKGWKLLGRQLTAEIAKLASVDSRVVASCEEKCDPLLRRLATVFWRGSYERRCPSRTTRFSTPTLWFNWRRSLTPIDVVTSAM